MRIAVVTFLGASLVLAGCQAPPPTGLSDADRAAIEQVSRTWQDSANAEDWEAVAATYSEDAVVMPPNTTEVKGRSAIRSLFAKMPGGATFKLKTLEIEGVGDLAYVRGAYEMTMDDAGEVRVADTGKYLEIRRKRPDGSWPITRDIYNSDLPMPEAEAPE